MPNFESLPNERKFELKEQEKRQVAELWQEAVVDNCEIPDNIEQLSDDEFRDWLADSVYNDIKQLVSELGIDINQEAIEKIKDGTNDQERAKLELKYIRLMFDQVDEIVQKFDKSPDSSNKWASWPKKMREDGCFNCVGATMLGKEILAAANIESYHAAPSGHAVNVVRLSNGDWWYVDFMNGQSNFVKIEPQIEEIHGEKCLKVDVQNFDYKLIPIRSYSESINSILGNLSVLQNDAENYNPEEGKDPEKEDAVRFMHKYGEILKMLNMREIRKVLYPDLVALEGSPEMTFERQRVKKLREATKSASEYIKSLDKKQQKVLMDEMRNKVDKIDAHLTDGSDEIGAEFSSELQKVLELFQVSLNKLKKEEPEIYQEAIESIINKLRSLE